MNLFIADALEYKGKINKLAAGNKNLILFLLFLFIPAKSGGVFNGLIHLSHYIVIPNSATSCFYLSIIFLLIYIVFYSLQKNLLPLRHSNGFISSLINDRTFFSCRIIFMIYSSIPISLFFLISLLSDNNNIVSHIASILFLITSFAVIGFSLSELMIIHTVILSFLFILLSIFRYNPLCDFLYTIIILSLAFQLFIQTKKNNKNNIVISGIFLQRLPSFHFINGINFLSTNKTFCLNIINSMIISFTVAYLARQETPEKTNDIAIIFFGYTLYISMILFYKIIQNNENHLRYLINFISIKNLSFLKCCLSFSFFSVSCIFFSLFLMPLFPMTLFIYYCIMSIFTTLICLLRTQYTKLIALCFIVLSSYLWGHFYA
ncbi:hypothetical protein FE394_00580 [Xenorhabdus sp. Reich]|uniref:Uncharacterized protein n=1 Tax=Xenorhabdus littoralis TaxID=2582835 RepID=A0ABU4SGL2_9GAMM|nr:hypothetical protein [Xenorhabdus sp. Reich]MDX7997729.1 hypothetical protein [Xenorhabdus sp. Reich]